MTTNIIVLSRELPGGFVAGLRQLGEVRVAAQGCDPAIFSGATVYVSTAVDPVPAGLFASFPPELRLVANIGVGTDNIDLDAATAHGVAVSNTPVVGDDTADLSMALLLATCRRLTRCESLLRDGSWGQGQGQLGVRVHGKTLGIIGFGAIGQAVARRARGFGMRILYHGPRPKEQAASELGAQYQANLNDLLAASDIVSLHCPMTPDTRHILNRDSLALLKPGTVIINTGRGALIHEDALVAALASGHLGGAGLDVFEFEPQVTPRLLEFDNVTLLPHIGSATGECRTDMAMRAAANIQAFLECGQPLDPCT